jgi:hypothetical protein
MTTLEGDHPHLNQENVTLRLISCLGNEDNTTQRAEMRSKYDDGGKSTL